MKLRRISSLVCLLLLASQAFAQDARSVELPNPMNMHTAFIMIAAGAFLAWCISYAIQLQRDRLAQRGDRADLRQRKEQLLDQLAELESGKESGEIDAQRYEHDYKELKFRLAKVIDELADPEERTSAKKTS